MATVPKEVLREMITGGNLRTAGDLHSYLKDMFKDALQQIVRGTIRSRIRLF